MKQILFGAVCALGCFIGGISSAATLGLTTGDPTVSASFGGVDYFESGPSGDLAAFADVDATSGVSLVGLPTLSFGVTFDLTDPTTGLSGGFGIDDDTGQFLSGSLIAVGFTDSVIELQFGALTGSGVANYGSSVLATVSFTDDLGSNPFAALVDLGFYEASISIANVQPANVVPLPAGMMLLLSGLFGFGWMRRRTPNTV